MLRRFDDRASQIEKKFDRRFVRSWRLYLGFSLADGNAGSHGTFFSAVGLFRNVPTA